MSERSPGETSEPTPGTIRDRLAGGLGGLLRDDPYRALAVGSLTALCLLVAGAGAVGVWARLNNTWEHFFLMEQLFATITPIVVGVGVLALLASVVAALRTG